MKAPIIIATIFCHAALCRAQVTVDGPLQMTGTLPDRVVSGLGAPDEGSSAITVEGSLRSSFAWAQATNQDTAFSLSLTPAITAYRDGLVVRFVSPASKHGHLTVSIDGLPPLPLERPDGLPISIGQVQQNAMCEVIHSNGRFILITPIAATCPSGFVKINEHYCMEAYSSAAVNFYDAVDICALKGAKLCSWDEFQAGCYWHEPEFTNLHVDWEWIDSTSNHTHGANQVARTTCRGIQTRLVTIPARTRCCYHLR